MPETKPFLSIVTITYKDPKGLKATLGSLASLAEESPFLWEHILVDHSSSETKEVLETLSPDWPLVHLQGDPRGIYQAQNEGMHAARGEYILFLNGGDKLYSTNSLLGALRKIDANSNLDLVFGSASLERDGKPLYDVRPSKKFLSNIIGTNRLCHQAIIYRRAALMKVGEYSTNYRIASDYEHHWRFYLKGFQAERYGELLCTHDMSGVSNNFSTALKEFRFVQKSFSEAVGLTLSMLNAIVWQLERMRLIVIKGLGRSPFASLLRPIWIFWKKAKHRLLCVG